MSIVVAQGTRQALKEWAVAIDALRAGEAMVTVRKGGIREDAREFRMEHRQFALFPSYDHQNVQQLQARYAGRLDAVLHRAPASGILRIDTWAEVTDVREISDEAQVRALEEFYVFSQAYALERLQWRPRKPLHVLILRVYRLAAPLELPMLSTYGGCKSWIELAEPVGMDHSQPALDDNAFQEVRARALHVRP